MLLAKTSLDSLSLASSWASSDIPKEYTVLQVEGISIQGCKFDGARTSPVESHDAVTASVPVCYMAWIPTVSSSSCLAGGLHMNMN
jgi:hypothetical protein